MAQAEGTSKNDGRVGPSTSGASKGTSSSSKSSTSSKSEKDDGRPTSSGIASAKSSGFSSSGRSGGANSSPSSKTGKSAKSSSGSDSGFASIGRALGSLLGGSTGFGGAGVKAVGSFGAALGGLLDKGPTPGRSVKESEQSPAGAKTSNVGNRDFSGLPGNYGTVANTLAAAGWTNSMIAGYLGNIEQESGANTKARNKGDAKDGTDSVGQGQWNMDRLSNLEKFSNKNNLAWDDPATQTKFTMHELATTHKNVSNKLAAAEDDPAAYAAIFGKNYEVSKQIPERQNYARGWASKISALGVPDVEKAFTKVDDFVSSIQNLGKPVGSKPTTQNTDPFGIGTLLSDTLGIQNPNTGKQKDGSYVDPVLSSVAGRAARGESNDPSPTKGRSGVAGVIEKGQKNQPLGVAAGIAKAAMDPIGFAVDTVMDLGNQSRGMNTPGAEGVGGDYSQQEFGLGFLGSLLGGGSGSNGGFAASEKNGSSSSSSASSAKKSPASPAVASTPAATPETPLTQAVAAPVSLHQARKPFEWSTITGSLDQLLGTTFNG